MVLDSLLLLGGRLFRSAAYLFRIYRMSSGVFCCMLVKCFSVF